jgi:hypothetical protein
LTNQLDIHLIGKTKKLAFNGLTNQLDKNRNLEKPTSSRVMRAPMVVGIGVSL